MLNSRDLHYRDTAPPREVYRVSFMFVERLDKEQLLVLRKVFPRACIELGIGAEEDDGERREQLASIILAIAQGEADLDLVLARAVYQMRPAGSVH